MAETIRQDKLADAAAPSTAPDASLPPYEKVSRVSQEVIDRASRQMTETFLRNVNAERKRQGLPPMIEKPSTRRQP